ncbi:MAG: hypothetical protein RR959_08895 [Erysipelotrichaceae bacterium]
MKVYILVKETNIVGEDGFETGDFDTTLIKAYQQESSANSECTKLNALNRDSKIDYCYITMEVY